MILLSLLLNQGWAIALLIVISLGSWDLLPL